METPNTLTVELHQLLGKVYIDDVEVEKPAQTGNTVLHNAVLTNDVNMCLREVHTVNLNAANLRGDTALHLAVQLKIPTASRIIEILISAGAECNAKNKWRQTPLHYAVIARAQENVVQLLKSPNIDLNAVDVNGFSPLHCCFSFSIENTAEYYTNISNDLDINASFIIMANSLIKAGASVNCQTRFKQSVLHFVATRDDNTPLIKYMLANFPEIDLTMKNHMGENFLHIYSTSEVCEEILTTLEWIAETCSPSAVNELLSDVDVYGRTPWVYMIDTGNVNRATVEEILGYGVSVNKCDNLDNTALHRIAGVSLGIALTDVIEVLINAGADLCKRNVYEETPSFVLFLDSVFQVFNKHKINFNSQDRWGRSPLMSIMKHRPTPDLIKRVILEGGANVNGKDAFGSTPLHFAAYHNYEEQVEILLELGADKEAKDCIQDKPVDTARRHCSYRCHDLLNMNVGIEILYAQTQSNILLGLPKTIKSTQLKCLQNIEIAMTLPEDRIPFWDYLLQTFYDKTPENANEVDIIVMEVRALVRSLCAAIAQYDPIFNMSIFPTGSSAEGTKVGPPDEFDFVLCIDQLEESTKPVITKECIESGFACLKFTTNPVPVEFLPFCDSEGYFMAFPFLQLFNQYLKRALNEKGIWKSGNLYSNYEDKMDVYQGKPVFNFDVYWIGSVYKQLKISIDLVPAVYKRGWWPANINLEQMPLMTEAIQKTGCFLILQSRSYEFDTKKHLFDSNVGFTCNNDKDKTLRRMLRVSAAPAEICLMKSLPVVFRRAYALAKIMKSKEVCPEVELETIDQWTKLLNHQKKFGEKKRCSVPVKPSHVIKSYMLKNCTFYSMLDMKNSFGEQDIHPSIITAKLYQYLLRFSDKWSLNPIFLPYSDVFEFEKEAPRTGFDDFMLCLEREMSIKLILGMLKQPFPEECLSSTY